MSPCTLFLLITACVYQACGNIEVITTLSGQTVVLKSGADQSRSLNRVQWSIYSNTTFIAGRKDGQIIDYKFWRYTDRLHLDNLTGDLTIKNVLVSDSTTYDVTLVYKDESRHNAKIDLRVQERFETPVIQINLNSLKGGRCHVALQCTVSSGRVNLSWTPDSDFNGTYFSGCPNSVDSRSELFASFSGGRNRTFNCTATSEHQTETKQISVGCSDEVQKCDPSSVCSSSCSCFSSVIVTLVIIALVFAIGCAIKKREKIRKHRFYILSSSVVQVFILRRSPQVKDQTAQEETATSGNKNSV